MAAALLAACGAFDVDLEAGEPCIRTSQCGAGLACVDGTCGTDLDRLAEAGVPPGRDAGPDAGSLDGGVLDGGVLGDGGALDPDGGGPMDGGLDAGPGDDAGTPGSDAGPPDAGPLDAGPRDAGAPGDGGPPPADGG